MFTGFGLPEILIIAFLIILFFGGKKIPDLVRGMGEAIKEFKAGIKEDTGGSKKKD